MVNCALPPLPLLLLVLCEFPTYSRPSAGPQRTPHTSRSVRYPRVQVPQIKHSTHLAISGKYHNLINFKLTIYPFY